jgi:diadenylate cyclase
LLSSLFWPGSPTHDGAVIIRENKIEAAGCLLPLKETPLDDRRLGMRHRAAMGLSETTDALIIIVSEETGIVSLAEKGNLTRYVTKEALEARLFNLYKEERRIFGFGKK